jgi:fructose-1,6-bisphosphatase I
MDDVYHAQGAGPSLYSVAYDPLDGSSLVDVNLSIGTIVSIYKGCDIFQEGSQQVAALYLLYGPRVSLVYSVGNGVHEFTMNSLMEFTLSRENISMAPAGDIYSPGGLRKKYSAGTEKFVSYLEQKGSKLRYSGGFVPDINQLLMKGKGIFLYPALKDAPKGKLRLLFELNPMAYLVEQAGGAASNGKIPILDIKPECLDHREPIYIGCSDDVQKAVDFLADEVSS